MLREKVLQTWKNCKEKVFQLKQKSIDNFVIGVKRVILGLDNCFSYSLLQLCDLNVIGGKVTKKGDSKKSKNVVQIHTSLLRVAILEELQEDNTPLLEESFLKNYEGEIDHGEEGPTIELVD